MTAEKREEKNSKTFKKDTQPMTAPGNGNSWTKFWISIIVGIITTWGIAIISIAATWGAYDAKIKILQEQRAELSAVVKTHAEIIQRQQQEIARMSEKMDYIIITLNEIKRKMDGTFVNKGKSQDDDIGKAL